MENTFTSMMDFWQILLWVVLVFYFTSRLFQTLYRVSIKGRMSWLNSAVLKKLALTTVAICILCLVLLILSLIWVGGWWLWETYVGQLTPGKLALISVVIGPIPLLIAMLGMGIAKMIGGNLDAAKVENCIVFGVDIGGVLYTMFMMHWFMIFTGGIAMIGLMVSGIWALVKLV